MKNNYILVVFAAIVVVFAFDWLDAYIPHPRHKARNAVCRSNLKQLSQGILIYAQDYNNRMPPAAGWTDSLKPYVKNKSLYVCPEAHTLSFGYSFYDRLDRVITKKISRPFSTPLLFDSTGGRNSSQPIKSAVARHYDGYNCSFADGHVKWVKP